MTAVAVAIALTSCVKAPVSPQIQNLTATTGYPVVAMIDGADVTVTVGDGVTPIQGLELATPVVVMGTLAEDAEEMTYTLRLAGDNAVVVTPTPTGQPQVTAVVARQLASEIAGRKLLRRRSTEPPLRQSTQPRRLLLDTALDTLLDTLLPNIRFPAIDLVRQHRTCLLVLSD